MECSPFCNCEHGRDKAVMRSQGAWQERDKDNFGMPCKCEMTDPKLVSYVPELFFNSVIYNYCTTKTTNDGMSASIQTRGMSIS